MSFITSSLPPFVYNFYLLYGTLLGDSYIDIKGRLHIKHSLKQSYYLYLKYFKLRSFTAVISTLPYLYSHLDSRTHNTYHSFLFMDDGGRNSSYGRGMVIDVSCFLPEHQLILANMLRTKFSLTVSFHRLSVSNTIIYISSFSAPHFCNLIRPYILPSMCYKMTC
jgi:hypothetical protein